jgi:hypothetical protein
MTFAKTTLVLAALLFAGAYAQSGCQSNTDCNVAPATGNCCTYNSVTLKAGNASAFMCMPNVTASLTAASVACLGASDTVTSLCSGLVVCTAASSKVSTCQSQAVYSASTATSLGNTASGLANQALAGVGSTATIGISCTGQSFGKTLASISAVLVTLVAALHF